MFGCPQEFPRYHRCKSFHNVPLPCFAILLRALAVFEISIVYRHVLLLPVSNRTDHTPCLKSLAPRNVNSQVHKDVDLPPKVTTHISCCLRFAHKHAKICSHCARRNHRRQCTEYAVLHSVLQSLEEILMCSKVTTVRPHVVDAHLEIITIYIRGCSRFVHVRGSLCR